MDSIVLCNNCGHSFAPKDNTPLLPIIDDLDDLLRSNQLPSCTETQRSRSYIEAESRELTRCENEITRLHDALEKLKAHRAALVERIESYQSWISPIRRLPVEILERIFALVCTGESGRYALALFAGPERPFYRWPGSISAPILALTHISHHWRAIANASSSLWSSIRISSNACALFNQVIRFRSVLALYLANSRDNPLHLTFAYPIFPDDILSISQLLALHIPRIARLDLVGPGTEREYGINKFPIPKWLENSLHIPPNLSSMKIYSSQLDPDKIPWHRLTVLEIKDVTDFQHFGRVLKLCTNLHSLVLEEGYERVQADALIEIKSLRRLSITVRHSWDGLLPALLRHLVLPSLSSFMIRSLNNDPIRLQSAIDLIHRSGCHLNDFAMEAKSHSYSDIPNADLRNFLILCPDLTQLEFHVSHPRHEDMNPGSFVCQLLDVLSPGPTNSDETLPPPSPSPSLALLSVSERWSTLDTETVDDLLSRLEARVGALRDYRARVPVQRWKWDLRFGALAECAPDVLEGFRSRIEKLSKSGLKWESQLLK